MNLINISMLVCCMASFLYGAETGLQEYELQRIEAFDSGFCCYISDECRATQIALLPDEIRPECSDQTCPASSIITLQKYGFTVENCCKVTAGLTYVPFIVSFGAVACNTVSCYTLSNTATNIWSYICWGTCPPALISCGMLEEPKKDNGSAGASCAHRIDKKMLLCAYNRVRSAHSTEMDYLLDKPQQMSMDINGA